MISVSSTLNWFGDRVLTAVLGDLDQRMHIAGLEWRQMSRSLAPVRTGRLRAQENFRVENHTLILEMGAPYDIFQEFGTRNMDPHPHIRPALNAIGRTLGFNVELAFNSPSAGTWQGLYAHQGTFVVPSRIQPRPLTQAQHHHVRHTLIPTSRYYHRGNVRKARMVVRRFD